jgi:hypothetical protein
MTIHAQALPAALLAVAAMLPLPGRATPLGGFTLLDGEAVVIRAASKFPAAEGLRVQSDDIIHTGAGTRIARIEFADGTMLDLGPATRVLLRPQLGGSQGGSLAGARAATPERVQQIYLLRGWAKLATPKAGPSSALDFASPQVDLQHLAGTVVVQSGPDDALVFVESGTAQLQERRSSPAARAYVLAAGQAYAARGGEAAVQPRPPPGLLQALPRAFADSLPSRAARYARVHVEPAAAAPITYDDVAEWINGERVLRLAFRERWAARAADPRFRAGLVADLKAHPEWDRLLFPHKYAQRNAPPPMDGALLPALTQAPPAGASAALPHAQRPARPPLLPYAGPASAPPPADADQPAPASARH